MQQIDEMWGQKSCKRREEVKTDRAYLRQCELNKLKIILRENEQRQKDVNYHNELAKIIDAQPKRPDDEIDALRSKLSQQKTEIGDDTLVNVDNCGSGDSDTESVCSDADESMNSLST